jgi:hypothetical protein
MRILVASFGAVLVLAASTGCSAQKQTRSSNDVFAAMHEELSHAIAQADPLDAMNDELSHAIGTTVLTSESLVATSILDTPMPLPETRMSLSEIDPPVLKTWGVPDEPSSQDDVPETRE